MGFTPGENTVSAATGGVSARFTATALPGTLTLRTDASYPFYERYGIYLYGLISTITAYVTDADYNRAISPAIQFAGHTSPISYASGWESTSQAYWSAGFDRRSIIYETRALVRFEVQEQAFQIDSLEMLGYYSFDLRADRVDAYAPQDTARVSVLLSDYEWGTPAYLDGVRVTLRADNGWTLETRSGNTVEWPLGSTTGWRTLTACLVPRPGYCMTVDVQVRP